MHRVVGLFAGVTLVATLSVGCSATHEGSQSPSTSAATSATQAPASVSAAPAAGSVVLNCSGKGEVKPAEIVFFCADANELVKDISWTAWEANAASGAGTLVHNTCQPTCVAGSVESTPVQVGVRAPEGDDHHFTAATVSFPDGHAENFKLPPPLPAQ